MCLTGLFSSFLLAENYGGYYLTIINEYFDNILGANSGGSSRYTAWRAICRKSKLKSIRRAKSRKMIRWIRCMASCSKEHYSIFPSVYCRALTSYHIIIIGDIVSKFELKHRFCLSRVNTLHETQTWWDNFTSHEVPSLSG